MFSIQNPIVILMSVVLGVPLFFYMVGRIRIRSRNQYSRFCARVDAKFRDIDDEIDAFKMRYGIEVPPMKAKFDEELRKTQKLTKATIRKVGKAKN